MDYFLVPWDTDILGFPVAGIDGIRVADIELAGEEFQQFNEWRSREGIRLCSCRVRQEQLGETAFLQLQGFRFIELNYHPAHRSLQQLELSPGGVVIERAGNVDCDALIDMAGQAFEHGRFHQDPALGARLGDLRYGVWMKNAFSHPGQTVYKCVENDETVGFFVVEYPVANRAYWSLIGLTPGMGGQGLGTRVWQAMMLHHKNEGMDSVETSISSHNVPALNLYVKLGFRFPPPDVTFHRHYRG